MTSESNSFAGTFWPYFFTSQSDWTEAALRSANLLKRACSHSLLMRPVICFIKFSSVTCHDTEGMTVWVIKCNDQRVAPWPTDWVSRAEGNRNNLKIGQSLRSILWVGYISWIFTCTYWRRICIVKNIQCSLIDIHDTLINDTPPWYIKVCTCTTDQGMCTYQ